MRVGILGTGNVGRTLAVGLAGAGHTVELGSRTPSSPELERWGTETGVARGTLADVASGAEVLVLTTAWDGTEHALGLAGPHNLAGKVLVDVTNPLHFTDRLELTIGHDDSGGEQVQRWVPEARVVKAFNTVGFELMVRPELEGGPGTMFIAGDDPDARVVVAGLAHDLGWDAHDCGDLRAARLTEPLAMIWIEHALRTGHRSHAFRLAGASHPHREATVVVNQPLGR